MIDLRDYLKGTKLNNRELRILDILSKGLNAELALGQTLPAGGGSTIQSVKGVIDSADILTGWDTPVQILPAPGANKIYSLGNSYLLLLQNTTRYSNTQDSINLRFGTTSWNSNTSFLSQATNILNVFNNNGSGFNQNVDPSAYINQPINIRFGDSANPITGDDDVFYYFEYLIVDLTIP